MTTGAFSQNVSKFISSSSWWQITFFFPHLNCTFLPRTFHQPPTHLGGSSADYAAAQGASKTTLEMFDKYQMASPGMNYGMVQSASTSSEFVSRCLVKQKKKFGSKSWEVINKVGSTEV